MSRTRSWTRSLTLGALLALGTSAHAADAPMCKPFDRMKPCCPHAPPTCCPAPLSQLVDDAAVLQICGSATVKGEAAGIDQCKRYYAHGEQVGEVDFSRQPGDAAALAKLRAALIGERTHATTITVAGATQAFALRELDGDGQLVRASAWALAGAEIVHVEAEREACDEGQVVRLLALAIERAHASRAPIAASGRATPTAH